MRVHYVLASYRSHRRAGLDNRRALQAAGVEIVDEAAEADVVILHDEPWTLPGYRRALPELRRCHVVAYAVWELSPPPPEVLRWLGAADEIWTASRFCASLFTAAGPPVAVIPHIVEPPAPDAAAEARLRDRLGLGEDAFVYYTVGRQEDRKNLEAAVRAFSAVADAGSRFVVKSTNPLSSDLARVPGVIALEGLLDDAEVAALHSVGHCYVAAHRAEGWGFGLSDAMATGNLVVATGYSGNMEFMDRTSALPVRYALEGIGDAGQRAFFGYGPGAPEPCWASVDEGDLRANLLRARRDWAELAPLRSAARARMRDFAAPRVAALMLDRLRAAPLNRPRPAAADPADPGLRPG